MNNEINLDNVPLSWLSNESRNLLSCLLNTTKVIPSDGPEKLPRDWRGLASLAKISAEVAGNINLYTDKMEKVLQIWISQFQNTAYVGNLCKFLQRLDRYDVWDDCLELYRRGCLIEIPNENRRQIAINIQDDDKLTYDDQRFGEPQYYHAFVLYAQEDKEFIDELLLRMREENLRLCTLDDLLPGHATQHAPVSRLISERCQRIILVYSPEFLRSPENSFYTDYAQAVGIEKKERKIIPIMYRDCTLPTYLSYYHKLFYSPPGQKSSYNFWQKLSDALQISSIGWSNSTGSNHSALRIAEVNSNSILNSRVYNARIMNNSLNSLNITNGCSEKKALQLQLPSRPSVKSVSMSGLDTCSISQTEEEDSKSQCSLTLTKRKQKKPSKIKVFIDNLTKNKNKKKEALKS